MFILGVCIKEKSVSLYMIYNFYVRNFRSIIILVTKKQNKSSKILNLIPYLIRFVKLT